MKVTFEFNDDEKEYAKLFMQAEDADEAVDDFRNFLRNREKYTTLSSEALEELEIITNKFYEVMDNHNVNLDLF